MGHAHVFGVGGSCKLRSHEERWKLCLSLVLTRSLRLSKICVPSPLNPFRRCGSLPERDITEGKVCSQKFLFLEEKRVETKESSGAESRVVISNPSDLLREKSFDVIRGCFKAPPSSHYLPYSRTKFSFDQEALFDWEPFRGLFSSRGGI